MFFFGHTQNDQHTEWIHRGSLRLEHMARFLEMKEVEEHEDDSDWKTTETQMSEEHAFSVISPQSDVPLDCFGKH